MERCMATAASGSRTLGSIRNKRSDGLLSLRNPRVLVVRAVASPATESSEDRGAADGSIGVAAQTSGQSTFKLEPAKKLREKRRSQWSTGTSPGEYGGPPLQTELRKMWGGNEADPLTETGEYIWKKNWQPYVEVPPSEIVPPTAEKEKDSGFLNLNRAIALDSLDVDLSKELAQPSRATLERQVRESLNAEIAERQKLQGENPKWRFAPTKREEIRWTSARKATTGGMEKMAREVGRKKVDPVVAAEAQRKKYRKLKQDLQLLTLAVGGLGAVGAYFTYSPEVAGSYGAGLIGALAYVRMLGNSVDSIGASDTRAAARGALGQPRLLVPVVVVMIYNRWNALLVPEYGVMSLQLIPMLVGFFTYKAATLVETFKELLPEQAEENI